MTRDEIKDWTKHELRFNKLYGHPTVDEIRSEFVTLMQGGGMPAKRAERLFEQIVKEV